MITDSDIKKLEAVFVTKGEFTEGLKKLKKEILDGVAEYLESRIITLLNDHEKRIDRLEKSAGGFGSVA